MTDVRGQAGVEMLFTFLGLVRLYCGCMDMGGLSSAQAMRFLVLRLGGS